MNTIIGLFLFISTFTSDHKFYHSISQLTYDEKTETLHITSRYTIDDIEYALQKRYDPSIRIDDQQKDASWKAYWKRYCNEKFKLWIDGQKMSYTHQEIDFEDDLLICNLTINQLPNFENVQVSNTLLMDFFKKQQHIIHVKKGKERKSLILEKENPKGILKFTN